MKNSFIGNIAIIMGSLMLSVQLFGLKIIQGMEMQSGTWKTNAIDYAKETPVLQSILLSLAVIIYGVVMVVGVDKIKEYLTPENQ